MRRGCNGKAGQALPGPRTHRTIDRSIGRRSIYPRPCPLSPLSAPRRAAAGRELLRLSVMRGGKNARGSADRGPMASNRRLAISRDISITRARRPAPAGCDMTRHDATQAAARVRSRGATSSHPSSTIHLSKSASSPATRHWPFATGHWPRPTFTGWRWTLLFTKLRPRNQLNSHRFPQPTARPALRPLFFAARLPSPRERRGRRDARGAPGGGGGWIGREVGGERRSREAAFALSSRSPCCRGGRSRSRVASAAAEIRVNLTLPPMSADTHALSPSAPFARAPCLSSISKGKPRRRSALSSAARRHDTFATLSTFPSTFPRPMIARPDATYVITKVLGWGSRSLNFHPIVYLKLRYGTRASQNRLRTNDQPLR